MHESYREAGGVIWRWLAGGIVFFYIITNIHMAGLTTPQSSAPVHSLHFTFYCFQGFRSVMASSILIL